MPKLKEVLSTEVHWQVPQWQIKDQANIRIRQLMGDNARYFAPVYVTHASYYWSDAEPGIWSVLTDAETRDNEDVNTLIANLRQSTKNRFPDDEKIDTVFSVPNTDYIFYRRLSDGSVDVRITGWGFVNYHRATGGGIIETIPEDKLRDVQLCFSIDGNRVALREFEFFQSTMWVKCKTDSNGLYAFGRLAPGAELRIRDILTGTERIERVDENTSIIDIDVTEYLTVRVNGRFDDVPVNDEDCRVEYGHRSNVLRLTSGVAECRLPWLEGVVCNVSFRGEQQSRELEKGVLNVFNFDMFTPTVPKTKVRVTVTSDGAPVRGEAVTLQAGESVRQVNTDVNGVAETEFDTPETAIPCTAKVRDAESVEQLAGDMVEFRFAFDTPVRNEFEAQLLVVDATNRPVSDYPIDIELTDRELTGLTDSSGHLSIGRVCGGDSMTVYDGCGHLSPCSYVLNHRQPEYVYMLPYVREEGDRAYTLRVIERDGRPAMGCTCVLDQDGRRIMSVLDTRGEMHFGSYEFDIDKNISVNLYSSRREFPKLSFKLEKDEFEYELKEVSGPTPWWKVLLEVLALLALGFGLFMTMGIWFGIFRELPLFFA